MTAAFSVPLELSEFILREPARTLLVRGSSGTGKTTFALTLLTQFRGQRLFVSNRVRPSELEQDFPWLTHESHGLRLISAVASDERVRDRAGAIASAGKLIELDADSAIVRKLWLPDAVAEALSHVRADERAMMVIDSWDALVEQYLGVPAAEAGRYPDRAEIERLLLGLAGTGQVHLVLVVEHDAPSQLDYLVDGVVHCTTQMDEDRVERWVDLDKLRGVRIDHFSYPFSLDGGRFRSIPPLQGPIVPLLREPDPDPSPQPGTIWPGSADLANLFGRFDVGRMTLIETDLDVPSEAVALLCTPIFSEVVRTGGRTAHILPPRTPPEAVLRAYRPLLSPREFAERVRVFSPLGARPSGPDAEVLRRVTIQHLTTAAEETAPRIPEIHSFVSETAETGIPNLLYVNLSGLEHASVGSSTPYTPMNVPIIVERMLLAGNLHMIMVGPVENPLTQGLREMASIKIAMRWKLGRVFVHGHHPETPSLVLAMGDGTRPYELVRIV